MASRQVCVWWTAVSVMLLVGCGSDPGAGAPATRFPTSGATASVTVHGPQPIEVQYLQKFDTDEGGPQVTRYHLITDGGTKVRLKISIYGDPEATVVGEEYLTTWDGNRVLVFSQSNEPPYTVYEAPGEHPDEVQRVMSWAGFIWSTAQSSGCTDLKTTKTIIGRTAAGYRCVEPSPEPGAPATSEVWFDQATGIMLQHPLMVAEKLVLDPAITATTFSTEPPPGARSTVVAAEHPASGKSKQAPDFTLELVKGGRIGLKDLVGQPFVLAFFPSDLAFDESGDAFPGHREALLKLQTLSDNGTKPRVLAVQEGSLGKPGYPLAVPGLTLPLAHEDTPTVNGLFALASFAFVGADSTIVASYNRVPTEQELTQSLAALR
ncbi:hypothetical protein EV648_10318 [Kribbella sp. VKM Ac-2568]|nr:hypothetical protein EV648_10318 [Kribbella sp. VKM Ac-2568]